MSKNVEKKKLIVATHNKGKLKELKEALKELPFILEDVSKDENYQPPIEDKETFIGNSNKKAIEASQHFGQLALADDSGLVVDALGGEPGVYSARYAGEHVSFQDNMDKVLLNMKNIEEGQRQAYFICVLSLADQGQVILTAEGRCYGKIAFESSGEGGFGYDPIFIPDNEEITFAEMTKEEKSRVSHRTEAIKNFVKKWCEF